MDTPADAAQTVDALGVSVQIWLSDSGMHAKSVLQAVDRPNWHEYNEIGGRVREKDARKFDQPWFEVSLAGLTHQAMYDYILGNIDRNLHKNQHVIGGCVRSCDGPSIPSPPPAAVTGAEVPPPSSSSSSPSSSSHRAHTSPPLAPIGGGCDPSSKRTARSCSPYSRLHEGWPAMVFLDQGWAFYLDHEPEGNPYTGDSKGCYFSRTVVERVSSLIEGNYGSEIDGRGMGVVDALWAGTPPGVQGRITRWHLNLLVDRGKKLLKKVDACLKAHSEDEVYRWV